MFFIYQIKNIQSSLYSRNTLLSVTTSEQCQSPQLMPGTILQVYSSGKLLSMCVRFEYPPPAPEADVLITCLRQFMCCTLINND